MPQVTQARTSLPAVWKIAILVAIFVLAVGGGAGLFLYVRDQDHKAVVNAINQRQTLVLQGKYDAALKLLTEAYPRAHSKEEKREVLYYVGATNLVKGDLKAAQKAFKEYESREGLTYEVARQLGYVAGGLGNKAEAISYYNKAIDLAKKEELKRLDDEVASLQARIKELQE